MRGKHPLVGIILSLGIVLLSATPQMRSIYAMPDRIAIMEEGGRVAQLPYPLTLQWESPRGGDSSIATVKTDSPPQLVVKLFDWVPIKRVAVDMKPPRKVKVGGHSIGVTMQMSGVLVVGFSSVTDVSGSTATPARDAGVRLGDRIVTVNEMHVTGDEEIARMVHRAGASGEEIVLGIVRDEELVTKACRAVYSYETQSYRIGLFVRDTAVGIGTLTYWEPTAERYGALGHVITDSDTNEEVVCASGEIMPAGIAEVEQGRAGHPGEKIGTYDSAKTAWGTVEMNTPFGIYGKILSKLENPLYPDSVYVAARSQVCEGAAEMLTVVDGERIESFRVEIEKIDAQDRRQGKNLLVHIVDQDLIARTGGIVQGMSGSPIMQDGRLIGAVTHVMVNDPTRGYGILIEDMLDSAG